VRHRAPQFFSRAVSETHHPGRQFSGDAFCSGGKKRALGAGNMVLIRFDLLKDPLPRDRYHLICTVMTLHHMMDTEKVLSDFHQLLEHPGYLCVADLDKEDGSFHHEKDFVGHTGFNRRELQEQVLRTGFRKVTFKTCVTLTKKLEAGVKNYPMFLMIAET
jgi:hypothetical protein